MVYSSICMNRVCFLSFFSEGKIERTVVRLSWAVIARGALPILTTLISFVSRAFYWLALPWISILDQRLSSTPGSQLLHDLFAVFSFTQGEGLCCAAPFQNSTLVSFVCSAGILHSSCTPTSFLLKVVAWHGACTMNFAKNDVSVRALVAASRQVRHVTTRRRVKTIPISRSSLRFFFISIFKGIF